MKLIKKCWKLNKCPQRWELLLIMAAFVFVGNSGRGQTTLVEFTLENNGNATSGIIPNFGASGSVFSCNTGGTAVFGGTGVGASNTGWDGGAGSDWWYTSFATTGFVDVYLAFSQGSEATGPKNFKVQWSLTGGSDPTEWRDVPTSALILSAGGYSSPSSSPVLPSACDHQSTVYLRWIKSSTDAVGGGAISSTAKSFIKSVKVSGKNPYAPSIQASEIFISSLDAEHLLLTWTKGNGNHRIVKMNTVNSFDLATIVDKNVPAPVSGYIGAGPGEVVVFNGTGDFASFSVPSSANTYWFRVFEYRDNGGAKIMYLTSAGESDNPKVSTLANVITPSSANIRLTMASLGATIDPIVGTIKSRGVYWSNSPGITALYYQYSETDVTNSGSSPAILCNLTGLARGEVIYYRCYATNETGTALSPESSFSNIPTFTGTGNWETAARWNVQEVPGLNGDPTFGSASDCPVIEGTCTLSMSNKCTNLTINSGNVLNIGSSSSLEVSGTITNNGGNAGLVIKSTNDGANETGSLRYDNAAAVSGTVERYMSGGLHRSPVPWHLISPAVTGGNIEDFVTLPGNAIAKNASVNYGLAPYNETTNAWTYYPVVGGAGSFVAGAGYEVLRDNGDAEINDDGTVSFKGTLNSTDQSIVINHNNNGWNLVGNPFPCALDINAFLNDADNVKSIDQSYVIYVPTLTNYRYVSITKAANYLLPPGEGFFVKCQANPTSDPVGIIKFKTTMKSSTSHAYHSPPPKCPAIELVAESGKDHFSTWLRYIPEMTKGLDPGYDAGLFNASKPAFALYSRLVEDNGIDFEQQCLPDNDIRSLVVPIGLIAKQGAEIRFIAIVSDLPANFKVYLEDRVSGKFTRLDESGSFYSIVLSAANTGAGRFYLHTTQGTLGIENEIRDGLTIYPLPQDKKIRVLGALMLPALATVYNVDGSLVTSFVLTNPAENDIPLKQVCNGVYILQIQSDKVDIKRKICWNNN
jgi:hypothetical protein